ncbi:MAG: hypothetical protein MJD61_05150 [Proteobacteria bacterium]|nr:hypothetical protein [Pseudomonadota bacterium]
MPEESFWPGGHGHLARVELYDLGSSTRLATWTESAAAWEIAAVDPRASTSEHPLTLAQLPQLAGWRRGKKVQPAAKEPAAVHLPPARPASSREHLRPAKPASSREPGRSRASGSGVGTLRLHLADGPRTLQVKYFDTRKELDLSPAGPDSPAGTPQCGEFSARYYPFDDETTAITWPNVPHSEEPDGQALYGVQEEGAMVRMFECDRVTLYPERAGTVALAFVLWHVNHADQETERLTIEIVR